MIPKLVYVGYNMMFKEKSYTKKNFFYIFSEKNNFTLRPESYEDFYLLVKHYDIVLKKDPRAKCRDKGLIKKIEDIKNKKIINENLLKEESNQRARIKTFFLKKYREHYESFGHKIAEGKISSIPDNIENLCEDYAIEETTKEFGEIPNIKDIINQSKNVL